MSAELLKLESDPTTTVLGINNRALQNPHRAVGYGKFVGWDERNSTRVARPYGFKGLIQNFREDSELAYEKAFLSLPADSICESVGKIAAKGDD